jgi:hypothetical protein
MKPLISDDPTLHVYADAAYAVHKNGSRSHQGIYMTLGNHTGPIYCQSSKQKLVATSICEAELMCLCEATKSGYAKARLLHELGAIKTPSFILHEDNEAAIIIAHAGEGFTVKAKHFRIRHDYLKEMISDGTITVQHCETKNMTADYLTKGMVNELFLKHSNTAMGLLHVRSNP